MEYRKCSKCGCSPAKNNVKLFRFPKPGVTNLIRCMLWAKYISPEKEYSSITFQNQLHNEHKMLCQQHFIDADFTDDSKTKLVRTAIPCDLQHTYSSVGQNFPLVDISNMMKTESAAKPTNVCMGSKENMESNGSKQISEMGEKSQKNILEKKCRRYMQQICQLRNRIKNLKQKEVIKELDMDKAVQKLSEKITPAFALLLQGQIRNFKKKLTGRRWTKEEKITALRIFKRSPTCYRLLRRLFPLPSQSILKNMLRQVPFNVGWNTPTFSVLGKFIRKKDVKQNYYSLLFDEMSIRKHFQYNFKEDLIEGFQDHGNHGRSRDVAAYALVFMLSGIRDNFKQPIAHYFSGSCMTADRLTVIIKDVLYQCFEAGINVVATVCDMDGINRRALTMLGSTIENPLIKVHNKEIITFFDTPHLLKCFRNLFMKYNLKVDLELSCENAVGKGIAKWEHVQHFYEVDKTNPHLVYAPTLSQIHLNPNSKQKMKVNLAAQLFSFSVGGGMCYRIARGEIPAESAVTANMIIEMDKMFDLMNADSKNLRRAKTHSTNWSKNSPRSAFLLKMKIFFEKSKFIGSPRRPPSQDGWILTINAFFKLKKKLETEKIYSLATRKVQQDPLENFFGCIRANCGSNTNPTCGQFIAGFKTAIISNLAHMGATGNCETDNNKVISNFSDFLNCKVARPSETLAIIDTEAMPTISEADINENDAELQACAYVSGFIIKKIKNNCNRCNKILLSDDGPENIHLLTEFKEYNELKRSLNYVNKSVIVCVEGCAAIIYKILNEHAYINNLRKKIKETIKEKIQFHFLNECIEHKEETMENIINSIFVICTKRFCVLKNREFSAAASAAALQRKMKIITHS